MADETSPPLTEAQTAARGVATGVERAAVAGDDRVRTAALAKADEGALVSVGQRRINLLWERTQAILAISVVEITLVVVATLILAPIFKGTGMSDPASATAAATGLVLLSNLVGNVTGFYFSRTNHTKTGGVGSQETPSRGE